MSRHLMTAQAACALLQALGENFEVCLAGGWAVDALLGEQTREHSDLDLWLPVQHLEPIFVTFAEAGVDRVFPWPGDRPWNFVLHDGAERRVDLHLYEVLPDGSLHYGPFTGGHFFPAEALAGKGTISGIPIRCEAPNWAVRWHTGYPPRPSDRHDVPLLCDRFGIERPDAFR